MPRLSPLLLAAGCGAGLATSVACAGRESPKGEAGDPMKQPAVEAIFATAREEGAGAALDSLAVAIARDSSLAPLGHQVAHGVGRYLVALEGFSPALLASCRPTFQAGCYHGVLEEYVARVPGGLDSAQVRALCRGEVAQAPIVTLECAHGFGHGAFTRAGHGLAPALASCDAMPAEALVRECQDGVFMQRIVARFGPVASRRGQEIGGQPLHDHGTDATPAERSEDTRAWSCNDVEPRYRPACWAYEPGAILARSAVSADSLAMVCAGLEPRLASECWRGLGKLWATWKGIPGGRTATEACARQGSEAESACLRGVIESLVDLDWSGQLASRFCGAVRPEDAGECAELMRARVALTIIPE
jgi:hypothetical protein